MAYRFHSLASSATPCKRRGSSCSQGEVFRKRARASTESHAAIPPVPVARRSTQGCFQGEGLPEDAEGSAGPRTRALALALRRVPRRAGRVQRIRPAQAARPKPAPEQDRRTKTRKGSQGKTSLQSLQRSSRDGEGGPKPIKTRNGPQRVFPCGPSRRVRRARPRHPPNANRPARGRSPCGPSRRVRRIQRVSSRAARAKRKAPSASATPCPPAALRCSTLGEGGLNCRVRDGTG